MKSMRVFMGGFSLLLIGTIALSQTQNTSVNHFGKDGFSFDYPAGWQISDQSTQQMQYLTLARDGYAEIIVRSPRAAIDTPAKEAEAKRIVQEGFIDAWNKNFSDSGAKATRSNVSAEIAAGPAECTRLSASLGGEPGRVDICWRLIEKRMVQLAIVGSDRDLNKTASAWDLVRNTARIEPAPQAKPSPTPTPAPVKQKP